MSTAPGKALIAAMTGLLELEMSARAPAESFLGRATLGLLKMSLGTAATGPLSVE